MSDLISRQTENKFERTINASDLQEWIMTMFPDWCEGDIRLIFDHIDKMPSAQPEKRTEKRTETHACDLISRQAAIDVLEKVAELYPWRVPGDRDSYSKYNEAWNDALDRAESEIEALPSAQPDSKELSFTQKKLDTISRQAAIDAMCELMHHWFGGDPKDEIREIKRELENLPSAQPEQRWIPCSKELPERNRVVLVTTKWDEVTEGVKLSGNAWFIGRGEENAFDSDIIAWMPKPEPYKEGGEDSNDDGALDEFDTEDILRKLPPAQPEVLACGEGELSAQSDIVRCEDCRHWKQETFNDGYCIEMDLRMCDADFYCGYAERRTDVNANT